MNREIFLRQLPSGQWPTVMLNVEERRIRPVDTLAITAMIIYLAQSSKGSMVPLDKALNFLTNRCYISETEGYRVWHFNAFYPPDWEDTALAVYLLLKNGRLNISELAPLRNLLIQNTPDKGTGVWIKDPYSRDNADNNHWDPTTALNVLRLHCLLGVDKQIRARLVRFVNQSLTLRNFGKATLYYTPPWPRFLLGAS